MIACACTCCHMLPSNANRTHHEIWSVRDVLADAPVCPEPAAAPIVSSPQRSATPPRKVAAGDVETPPLSMAATAQVVGLASSAQTKTRVPARVVRRSATPDRMPAPSEAELAKLTKRQLRQKATAAGIEQARIQEAQDGSTPKADVSRHSECKLHARRI